MALTDFVSKTLEKRRSDFTRYVENTVGKSFSESDSLVNFYATALRKIENGATAFEGELWSRAVISVATSPSLHWRELLTVLDTGRFEESHLILLRIFADPTAAHRWFKIPIPVNDSLVSVLGRVINQVQHQRIEPSEIIRLAGDLQRLGLVNPPALSGQLIASIPCCASDLGRDLVRLLHGNDPPLCPTPKPVEEKPKKTKTNLLWLAKQRPEIYEYAETEV